MKPEGSLPHSQEPATCFYTQPDQSSQCHTTPLLIIHFHFSTACVVKKKSVRVLAKWSLTSQFFSVRRCSHHSQPPSWMIIPCRLSCIFVGLSSIRNTRTRHAVLTWNNLSRLCIVQQGKLLTDVISTPTMPASALSATESVGWLPQHI